MQIPPDSWESIGVSGALLRTYADDQKEFLPLLATLLEQAMPAETQVERKPVRLFSSQKRVVKLTIKLGDDIYTLEDRGPTRPLLAQRVKVVRGINLRTDEIRAENWLTEVGAEISTRAEKSEQALYALRNFLEIKTL